MDSPADSATIFVMGEELPAQGGSFAAQLQRRLEGHSYRRLAAVTPWSKSFIGDRLAGRRPLEPWVLQGLLEAVGAEPKEIERWLDLQRAEASGDKAPAADSVDLEAAAPAGEFDHPGPADPAPSRDEASARRAIDLVSAADAGRQRSAGDGPAKREASHRQHGSKLPWLLVALLTAGATVAIIRWQADQAPHHPVIGVRNTSETPPDGVWFNSQPRRGDSDKVTGHGVYMNDQIRIQCWARGTAGASDAGDTLWYLATNITRPTVPHTGAVNAGYLNDHYVSSGLTPGSVIDGVRRCPEH